METARIRLEFDGRHLLSKSQKLEGLKRCWLLVKPELQTISDLISYIIGKFDLEGVCSDGILLSMEGFVVPSFESISIFRDNDTIRVRKKTDALPKVIGVADDGKSGGDSAIMEKEAVLNRAKLLTIREFEHETRDYQSEYKDLPEDILPVQNPSIEKMISKKKCKHSHQLMGSKKRKTRSSGPEKSFSEGAEEDICADQNESCHQKKKRFRRTLKTKESSQNENSRVHRGVTPETNYETGKVIACSHNEMGSDYIQGTGQMGADMIPMPDVSKKFPSRSARRKKAKRQWLRELANSQKNELIQNRRTEKDMHPKSPEHQKPDQDTDVGVEIDQDQNIDMEHEIVPVVVRPGHIRFEPIGEEHNNHQLQDEVETFQWSGTTSKKKGQKWGKEKTTGCQRNNNGPNNNWNCEFRVEERELQSGNFGLQTLTFLSCSPKWTSQGSDTTTNKGQKWDGEKVTVQGRNGDSDTNPDLNQEEALVHCPVDFEKLTSLSCSPKEGDVVAYRLVELSSSWCPDLSPFRVGKVASYDYVAKKVILVPVPEYPITSDEKKDDDLDFSIYNEDGSLEIDFASLVDVRIFSHENSDTGSRIPSKADETPVSTQEAVSLERSDNTVKVPTVITENGVQGTGWEEITHVLSERKSQLLQEDGGTTRKNSVKAGWSYKGLRGSALGPTIALLRSRNELSG